MEKGYVYRAYPNAKQCELIKKTFGCKRFVYNYFLRLRIDTYSETKKTLSYNACSKRLTDLKRELPFLLEPDKNALQNALCDLDKAYENFFGTVHSSRKRKFGYPRFKSKRDNYQSYRTNLTNNNIAFDGTHIKLPKLGRVRIRGGKSPCPRGTDPQCDRAYRTRWTVLHLDLRDRRARARVGAQRRSYRYRPWYQRPRDPFGWHAI